MKNATSNRGVSLYVVVVGVSVKAALKAFLLLKPDGVSMTIDPNAEFNDPVTTGLFHFFFNRGRFNNDRLRLEVCGNDPNEIEQQTDGEQEPFHNTYKSSEPKKGKGNATGFLAILVEFSPYSTALSTPLRLSGTSIEQPASRQLSSDGQQLMHFFYHAAFEFRHCSSHLL